MKHVFPHNTSGRIYLQQNFSLELHTLVYTGWILFTPVFSMHSNMCFNNVCSPVITVWELALLEMLHRKT